MATFIDDEEELWKKCPFNPVHCVSKRRYALHLLKCPDRNRKGFVCCPYNLNHRIEEDLLCKHIQECEDGNQHLRAAVEQYKFRKATGKCFIYESSDKKYPFEDDAEKECINYEEYASTNKEDEYVIIPGLQEKVEAEDLVEKVEKTEVVPSAVAVQRLPPVSRRKLHKLLIALKKTKEIEADNELDEKEKCDFYKEWDLNFIGKKCEIETNSFSTELLNIETKVSNLHLEETAEAESDEENDTADKLYEYPSSKTFKPNILC